MSTQYDKQYFTSHIPMTDDADKKLKTYPECLRFYAETRPDKEAFVFVRENGERQIITWGQLYSKSCIFAKYLIKVGLKSGNVVCLCMKKGPDYVYSVFGIMLAGCICCPIPSSLFQHDGTQFVNYIRELGNVAGLVLDPCYIPSQYEDGVTDVLIKYLIESFKDVSDGAKLFKFKDAGRELKTTSIDNVVNVEKIFDEDCDDVTLPEVNESNIAYLLGSMNNSDPKTLCGQTQGFNGNIYYYNSDKSIFVYGESLFSLCYGFPHNVRGGFKLVTLNETGKQDGDRLAQSGDRLAQSGDRLAHLINAVRQERCIVMTISPSITSELIAHKDKIPDNWPVKIFISGGRPNDPTHRELFDRIATIVECAYVNTELGTITYHHATASSYEPYSVGRLREGLELKIVDSNEAILPVGQQGELWLRSKRTFPLYYVNPVRNAEIIQDGWLKTGDAAMMKDNGELFVYGKIK